MSIKGKKGTRVFTFKGGEIHAVLVEGTSPQGKLIGVNCDVCHGKNITEEQGAIIHNCKGWLEPVYA